MDCYACFVGQALDALRLAGVEECVQKSAMEKVLALLQGLELTTTPPEIGRDVHAIIRKVTGVDDPYLSIKTETTGIALGLYPALKEKVAVSSDPIDTAIRLAVAGNILDSGIANHTYDIMETIERALTDDFAIDDRLALRQAFDRADWLLYLGDNTGETVFDRILIETLAMRTVYAVKSGPILNDATLAEARDAGLDGCAELVETGLRAPGCILADTSAAFRELYAAAPLIIAKGQGNYETLSTTSDPRLFHLLQAKCRVIAADLRVPQFGLIVERSLRNLH